MTTGRRWKTRSWIILPYDRLRLSGLPAGGLRLTASSISVTSFDACSFLACGLCFQFFGQSNHGTRRLIIEADRELPYPKCSLAFIRRRQPGHAIISPFPTLEGSATGAGSAELDELPSSADRWSGQATWLPGTLSALSHYRSELPSTGSRMTIDHTAFAWGARAAREGLPIAANPYLNAASRRAWAAGHAYDLEARKRVDFPG